MANPLRVLMVEDSEDDAVLMIHALKKGGYDPSHERVESAEAMRKALLEKAWDIVLCDYQMPRFTGLDAIALLKETGIDIPLIVVSGAIGEEIAVACMRRGASDYVMKGNFTRLVPAVERELKEAESRRRRRRAEESLKRSELEKTAILESLNDIVVYQNLDMEIVWTNRAAAESAGLTQEELVGRRCYEMWYGRSEPCVGCPVLLALETGRPQSTEMATPDGRSWVVRGYPVTNPEGDITGIVEVTTDITDRKEVEQALREAHDIINKSSTVVFTWKNEEGWPVEYVSENVVRLFGYEAEEFMTGGVNYAACIHPEDVKWVAEEVAEFDDKKDVREFDHKPYRIVAKDGSEKIVRDWTFIVRNAEGRITQYKGLVEDITERIKAQNEQKRLEVQLRHAQRMEAISTLAGGIAHDFNNILSAVMGYTQLAQMKLDRESEPYEDLKQVIQSANRAKLLIGQILAVGRSQEQEKQPMQLTYTVKEALKLLRSTLPSTIEIQEAYDKDVGIIDADPTQMHQVLMNLCTNAGHALQERGGVLLVSLQNAEIEKGSWELNLRPGAYVKLSVSDTGVGMTPEIMERIFDPYFTTKKKGEGTGIGLSVVHAIVTQHGGTIVVESELGKGSVFHVYLPSTRAREKKQEIQTETPVPTGQERILFVDDEPALAMLGKKMLEGLGYTVTAMTDSLESLALFRSDPEGFDLVITDTTMPHMPGDILAQEMMKIRPDIPVVITTGHSRRISEKKAEELGLKGFIMKPLIVRDLAETVRKALGDKPKG